MSDNMRVNVSKERADAEMANAAAAAGSHPDVDEEISVIQNMTSFLLEHGGAEVDSKVLRTIAEALSKRLNDTSPSTLKDVTMEHSYGVGFPCVSLQGHGTTSPPVQGRSVREFEEQMASLRKENFNLKLRLYFLEESVPGYHQANAEGHDSLMKQLIETKVEIEILRKELEQKQELLKEAAQAMNHMEDIQKETESKGQAFIEELKQKIQFLEMERDLDKTQQSGFMNDLLGHSEISENVNTLQKIRELEGMVTQSESKIMAMQTQNNKFEELLAKRDETIKEYEEKVKELAFQNAELLEMMENKEKDMANIELNLKSLRLCNADLKEDNSNLIEALKSTQDNFHKEFSNMKVCEKRMREQQDALSQMQSTISLKTANTARLLERIQDYEKMVTKMNFERNLAKRENRFFRAIIGKLQRNKNECFTIEKEEFYQQYAHEYDEKPVDCNKQYDMNYRDMLKGRGDFHGEYLLKHKLLVNYSNNAKYSSSSKVVEKCEHDLPESKSIVKCCYLNDGCARHRGLGLSSGDGGGYGSVGFSCEELEDDGGHEPAFPIRYTISDASMFGSCDAGGVGVACASHSGSCTSLQANFSAASLYCGDVEPAPVADRECMQRDLKEKKIALADKLCELDDAQQELVKLRKSYDTACRTLQQLLQREKQQQQDGVNRALSDSEALQNHLQKCDHENTIKNLEAEVKKKTAALQNLVNNELWQKNREIERLTKLVNANTTTTSPLSPTAARKNLESLQLQQSFTESDYAKALEHNKLLQRKVDVLNQRLISGRSNEALIEELRLEARTARAEADNAETCRVAYAKVFGALSDRLYELAGFLNSLMKHKEVLSFLSTDRRRAMRTAVDCSLDLSTSIRETLTTGDQSFEGLSNLSRLLLDDDEHDVVGLTNKTLNSHEHLRARHSFDVLRSENKALRKILDSRRSCGGTADYAKDAKDRRSLPPFLLDNLSESEAWSEPDRQVSMARIGLEEHGAAATNVSVKDTISKQAPTTADTDSESESDALQQSRTTKLRNQERITQLEKLIAQRDERILMVQFQLVEADNNLKKESLRAITLTQEVEQLRQRNEELITDLIAIGSEPSNASNAAINSSVIQRQIDEKTRAVEQLQGERDRIAVEARLAEVQVGALKADIEDIKQKYEIQLKLASEKERQRLDTLKHELEELMQQRLKEQERIHKDTLTREWIARTTYEECKAQLTELQTQYIEAQRNIDYLTENEQELKESLITSEMEVRSLKKQLDESVLQASKFITERTKLYNEKLQVEKRLMDLQQQLSSAERQHTTTAQRVKELEALQQTLNEQLAQAQLALAAKRLNASDASQSGYASDEVQKSSTKRESNSSPDLGIHSDTGRVSSVELSNLQRSLLKTVPMPSGGEKVTQEDIRYSKQDKSNINALVSKRPQHSSSSDLGIESDTGRTSSMDIKNESPTRTETDDSNTENKMSVANVNASATATAGANAGTHPIHDCIKVEQENAELRRKLVQTKRAFEETYKKLHIANQRKETFQKEIKDQILKTKNVLKYARLHMAKVQQPNAPHHHETEAHEQETQHNQQQQKQHHHHQQQQQRNVTNDGGASTSKSSSDAPH